MPARVPERLTEEEVRNVILAFFELNASRAPIKAFEEILDLESFEIVVRGTEIAFKGIAGLADHQIGKLIFFDQRFETEFTAITIHDDHALAKTKDRWHASVWQSPAPYSRRLIADLDHTWKVVRCERTRRALLTFHSADTWKYLPGHAPEEAPKEFHLVTGDR
jgi:hypothetical protein